MKLCPQCEYGFHDSAVTCPTHGGMLSEIRDLRAGMVIRRSYRIVKKLGQGGMGSVYLAEQLLMGEHRALKFLSSDLGSDTSFTSRFLREVRTLRQVRHKNVVDCGDLEPAEDDSLFFAMEFVDGPDLRALMRNEGARMDVRLALELTRGMAEGLGAAHAVGLVHRDVKPENILLARGSDRYTPKIADFGIVATRESSGVITRTGTSLLTPQYAAPEQWLGTRAAELDGRTDIYALGGVLFEMLTGEKVFDADNFMAWGEQHRNTPPRPPSQLRAELVNWQGMDALVLRMLAKQREQRPADIAEVLRLLDAVAFVAPRERRQTQPEPKPVPKPAPQPAPTPKRAPTEPIEWAKEAPAEAKQLSPEPPVVDEREIKPKKGLRWRWEYLIVAIVAMVFYFSWQKTQDGKKELEQSERLQQSAQVPADDPRAAAARAAEQGDALMKQEKYADAAPLYQQACQGGYPSGCASLASLYQNGFGVPKDVKRANTLLTNSCEASVPDACVILGVNYDAGTGTKIDHAEARRLFSQACEAGDDLGCVNLALGYKNGTIGKPDPAKAVETLTNACNRGLNSSCADLGKMYEFGDGIASDPSSASTVFSRGCTAGSAENCADMGDLIKTPEGSKLYLGDPNDYYRKACKLGHPEICEKLGISQ